MVCLAIAYVVDYKTSRITEDYAFWLYLFGLIFFWFSITFMNLEGYGSEYLLYFFTNLGLIILSIFLHRRAFIVFGATGVFYVLYQLSYRVFQNSLWFPLTLMVLGLLLIYGGIQYQRNEEAIERFMVGNLPMSIRQILPRRRA